MGYSFWYNNKKNKKYTMVKLNYEMSWTIKCLVLRTGAVFKIILVILVKAFLFQKYITWTINELRNCVLRNYAAQPTQCKEGLIKKVLLSSSEYSEHTSLSSVYREWSRRQHAPSVGILRQRCDVFGVNSEWILLVFILWKWNWNFKVLDKWFVCLWLKK